MGFAIVQALMGHIANGQRSYRTVHFSMGKNDVLPLLRTGIQGPHYGVVHVDGQRHRGNRVHRPFLPN